MSRKQNTQHNKLMKHAMAVIALGWVCVFTTLLFPDMSREALLCGFLAVALISFGAGMMAAHDYYRVFRGGGSDDGSAEK